MHSAVLRLPGSIVHIAILIIAKGARWRNLSINIFYASCERIHDFCQRRTVLEQAAKRLMNALHDEAIDESFPAACFNESSALPLPTMRQAERRRKSTGLTKAPDRMQATCTNGFAPASDMIRVGIVSRVCWRPSGRSSYMQQVRT